MNVAMKIAETCQTLKAYSPVPAIEVKIPSSILAIMKYANRSPKEITSRTEGPLIEPMNTNNNLSFFCLSARLVRIARVTRKNIAKITKVTNIRPAAMAPTKAESVNWIISTLTHL